MSPDAVDAGAPTRSPTGSAATADQAADQDAAETWSQGAVPLHEQGPDYRQPTSASPNPASHEVPDMVSNINQVPNAQIPPLPTGAGEVNTSSVSDESLTSDPPAITSGPDGAPASSPEHLQVESSSNVSPNPLEASNIANSLPPFQQDPSLPGAHDTPQNPQTIATPLGDSTGDRPAGESQGDEAMFFRRRAMANTPSSPYDADLTSKDKVKGKEAIRRYLHEKIKNDWTYEWPQPAQPSSSEAPAPPHSPITTAPDEDRVWKERDEWMSEPDVSDDENGVTRNREDEISPSDPYRFESPDAVGDSIQDRENARKKRRRKRILQEMSWNDGVACFVHRRNAWTGARHVPPTHRRNQSSQNFSRLDLYRVRSSESSNVPSPRPDHRNNQIPQEGLLPNTSTASIDIDAAAEMVTLIPVAPPLLPPANPMRQSINPHNYLMIYDKVIIQGLTPACPMNLSDVIGSCVKGWQRDGEWPPKGTTSEASARRNTGPKPARRKLSLAGVFGSHRERAGARAGERAGEAAGGSGSGRALICGDGTTEVDKSGLRKGIQKVLGGLRRDGEAA